MLKEKQESKGNITFLSITGGEFRKVVPEGTPGAIKREWSVGGKSGVKWELPFPAVEGTISSLEFHEGEYGKNLKVWIKDGEELFCVSAGVKTGFGEDMLKKLPAVDYKKTVELTPYEFTPDGANHALKGVTFKQEGNKLTNFYRDADRKPINGIPTADGILEDMDKEERREYWTSYFAKVRRFMIKEVEDKIIPNLEPAPKFEKKEEVVSNISSDIASPFDDDNF